MLGSLRLNGLRKMAQTLAMPLSPAIKFGGNPNPLSSNILSVPLSTPPTFLGQSIRSIGVKTFEIPDNKRLGVGLQRIHGIGRCTAHQILCDLRIENKLAKDLTSFERFSLGEEIYRYMIDRELRQFNQRAIDRLKQIQCYRGIRHEQNLPCRGQRTSTNARTKKGKGVAIPGKKKAGR